MISMSRKRRSNLMPTREAIALHWNAHIGKLGIFNDSQDELPDCSCWACGRIGRVERCHILSYHLGGPDTVENLVILCAGCHVESEHLPPDRFWMWIRHVRKTRWRDEWWWAQDRLHSVGYPRERIESLGQEKGFRSVLGHIAKDIYPLVSVDDALRMVGLRCSSEGIESIPTAMETFQSYYDACIQSIKDHPMKCECELCEMVNRFTPEHAQRIKKEMVS
jgi:hypothetical protein